MKISEKAIAEVVNEAAKQLSDGSYVQLQVSRLAAEQPRIFQYVMARKGEISMDTIAQLLFHATLIQQAVAAVDGQAPRVIDDAQLQSAAAASPTLEALNEKEPHLASFILSNLDMGESKESELVGTLLAHIAQALVTTGTVPK